MMPTINSATFQLDTSNKTVHAENIVTPSPHSTTLRPDRLFRKTFEKCRKKLVAAVRRLLPSFYYKQMERKVELRVHWVKPDAISLAMNRHPKIDNIHEVVLSGDWDQSAVPFNNLNVFKAFSEVFNGTKRWNETEFYLEIISRINSGERLWECVSEEEFKNRVVRLEELYHEIKNNSYIPNNNHDELTVAVGRNGELIHYDGRHRLVIAKLLGLESVPIRIVARHPSWLKFKNEILHFAREHDGKVYAPLLHPDLEWIPSFYGHKRFEMIRHALGVNQGTLLDIGCNWGYFCHRFEELGFDCTGVEKDPYCFHFLTKLRRACNRNFKIFNLSIFNFIEQVHSTEFDIVLALAIFHHFIKTKDGYERLKVFLRTMHMREMYFLPHKQSESQMQNVYWNPTTNEFVSFISEMTGLRQITCLGSIDDGRKLYRLN